MGYHTRDRYGLWVMGYVGKIPANQLGKFKKVWVMREYGLSRVWVMRESTVSVSFLTNDHLCQPFFNRRMSMTLWVIVKVRPSSLYP
jgi:hypothetical protein